MNRDSGSERDSQRTVADLLAQYGEGSGGGTPRRRRRRAEDASETAPQEIINRVLSDSGQMRALRDEPPAEPEPPRAANVDAPSRRDLPSYDTPSGRFARPAAPSRPTPPPPPPAAPAPDPAELTATELTTEVPAITDEYPAIAEPPSGTATSGRLPRPEAPPAPPKPAPRSKPRVQPDPVTEVLPVIEEAPPAEDGREQGEDWFADTGYQEVYQGEGEHTAQYQAVRAPEPEAEAEAEPEEEPQPARAPAGLDEDAEVPDTYEDEEDEEPRSPAKEWLMMALQLGGGVLGGAGLWLGFQWLWRAIPSITLFLALAVIGGMVWLVRKIRKADDLQTILLAVLVGLVVTVSPAALLLVGK